MRSVAVALAAGILVAGLGQALAQTAPPAPAAPGADLLPPGSGRDTVMRVCTACHAPDVIAGRTQWDMAWYDLVQSMVDKGAIATPAEVDEIATYLEKAFPHPAANPAATNSATAKP